jgi:putative endonuclease
LAKNYRNLKAEVDLIVQKENTLVVEEVKVRSIGFVLSPDQPVSNKKIKLLVQVVDHFVQSRALDVEVRFDLITYVFDGDQWDQNYIN